jgi:hypothetical protein
VLLVSFSFVRQNICKLTEKPSAVTAEAIDIMNSSKDVMPTTAASECSNSE